MDRETLQGMLGEGLSLAEIGRRVGRHEATVSYWVAKYGLRAAHAERHAARGGLTEQELRALIDRGLSIAEIADQLRRSKATVRHWLRRYELATHGSPGRRAPVRATQAKEEGLERVVLSCRRHGEVEFVLSSEGRYRCSRCASDAVAKRRRRVKEILVEEAGGECLICGYKRSMRALHFHHLDPAEKQREINARGAALAIATLRAEAAKCVLLCADCHMEVEEGHVSVEDFGARP